MIGLRGSRIGKSVRTGRVTRQKVPELSTYMVGAHGTGKSTLIENLILADIMRNDKAVVFLDPPGDVVKNVMARCPLSEVQRVTVFAPAWQHRWVLGLNGFEIRDEREYELRAGAWMNVFAHTWYGSFHSTPTLQNTLETLVRTLLAAYPEYQTSILHMLLLTELSDQGAAWRRRLAPFVQSNPALAQNWREWQADGRRFEKDVESTRQKVKHIITGRKLEPILCQPKSADCFQFQEVLSQNGVLLVSLEGLDKESQRLLGSIILEQLLLMAKLRETDEDRVPCHVYADEFHLFSSEAFTEMINEARKYKLFCTLAHQSLKQLGPKARAAAANCPNVIVFRVGPEDSRELRHHFLAGGEPLPPQYLSNLPRFEAMVRYEKGRRKPGIRGQAHVKTFPVYRERDPAVAQLIHAQSLQFGTPLEDIIAYRDDILKFNHNVKSAQQKKGKPRQTANPPARTKREAPRLPFDDA